MTRRRRSAILAYVLKGRPRLPVGDDTFMLEGERGRSPRALGLRVRTFAVEDEGDDLRIVIPEASP